MDCFFSPLELFLQKNRPHGLDSHEETTPWDNPLYLSRKIDLIRAVFLFYLENL